MKVLFASVVLLLGMAQYVFGQSTHCSATNTLQTNLIFKVAAPEAAHNREVKGFDDKKIEKLKDVEKPDPFDEKVSRIEKSYPSANFKQRETLEYELFKTYFDQKTHVNLINFEFQEAFPDVGSSPSRFAAILMKFNPYSPKLDAIIKAADSDDIKLICTAVRRMAEKDPSIKIPAVIAIKMLDRLEALAKGSLSGRFTDWVGSKGSIGGEAYVEIQKRFKTDTPIDIDSSEIESILDAPMSGDRRAVLHRALHSSIKEMQDSVLPYAAELGKEGDPILIAAIKNKKDGAARAIAKADHLSPEILKQVLNSTDKKFVDDILGWLLEEKPTPEKIEFLRSYLDSSFKEFAALIGIRWYVKFPQDDELTKVKDTIFSSKDPLVEQGVMDVFSDTNLDQFKAVLLSMPNDSRTQAYKKLYEWSEAWLPREHKIILNDEKQGTFMAVSPEHQAFISAVGERIGYFLPFIVLANLTHTSDPKLKAEVIQTMRDLKLLSEEKSKTDEEFVRKFQIDEEFVQKFQSILFGIATEKRDDYQKMKKKFPEQFRE